MASNVAALRADATAEAPGGEQGVFVASDSLTFPGATAVCTTLLLLVGRFREGAATSVWWALIVCTLVGAVIIALGMPKQNRGGHIAVGVINILLLTASVLGIGSLASDSTVTV